MILGPVENLTPFTHFAFEKMGPGQRLYDVIVVKAACALLPGRDEGIVTLDEPASLHLADEHYGPPQETALRRAGDTLLHKPATDLFITGHARPLKGMGEQWAAQIEIKCAHRTHRQRLRLLGERHWRWSLLRGWQLSAPQTCESLPLRYELAFGGRYEKRGKWIEHADNPVGLGLLDPERMDRAQSYPAARIELFEHPTSALGKPIPVPALGPLPRFWPARSRYAGTYDAAWRARFDRGIVDYPQDFDPRFFLAAHPDYRFAPALKGREHISLLGLSGDEPITGHLPAWRLEALLVTPGKPIVAPLRLDTVEIDLDAARLYITWRLPVPHPLQTRHAVLRHFAQENA